MKLKLLAIAVASASLLTACGGEDGDDGRDGLNGLNGQNGVSPDAAPGAPGSDGANGEDGQDGADGKDGANADAGAGTLTRIATVPSGAEVTGLFLTEDGDLFFNAQHPAGSNMETDNNGVAYNTGTVGVIEGVSFNNLPNTLISVAVPESDYERQTIQTAYGSYRVIGQTGDQYEGELSEELGHIYNLDGDALILENDMPDFNGFVSTGANTGYLFTNWEEYPGGMSRIGLSKSASGEWSVEDAMMVNFANVKGTGANCFGSVSPWNTPLTSEEWIVNSDVNSTTYASWNDPEEVANNDRLNRFWQLMDEPVNPYDYGYIVEITNAVSPTPVPVKHFTIGRYEHENSVVMPDRRTVYSSQDDTGGVLFKFVADTAEDLSSGTLYGAKLTQDAGVNDPAVTGFDVDWVELATSDNSTIEAWVDEFDGISTEDYVDGETSYMTVADVEAWAAWVVSGRPANTTYPTVENGGGKVTAGQPMDDRAAFLESRQAAKQLGATAEWRKLEGISIHAGRVQEAIEGIDLIPGEEVENAYMYMGIADIDNTMIDGEGDIQLSGRVKDCGGVFRALIDSDYSLSRIEPVVMGATYRSSLDGAERCDVDNLSQPDNVIVMQDGRILIGEDGFQENNTLWMYEPHHK